MYLLAAILYVYWIGVIHMYIPSTSLVIVKWAMPRVTKDRGNEKSHFLSSTSLFLSYQLSIDCCFWKDGLPWVDNIYLKLWSTELLVWGSIEENADISQFIQNWSFFEWYWNGNDVEEDHCIEYWWVYREVLHQYL